jgi:hypothetical protein
VIRHGFPFKPQAGIDPFRPTVLHALMNTNHENRVPGSSSNQPIRSTDNDITPSQLAPGDSTHPHSGDCRLILNRKSP